MCLLPSSKREKYPFVLQLLKACSGKAIVMSDGRSIRLPSAKFAQVREPGRNGPAVTGLPEWDAEVQILPCAPCASVRELE